MDSTILKLLIPAVLSPVLAMGQEKAKDFFEKEIDKDPKKGQAIVGIIYTGCKGFLDEVVANTSIPYDDQAVTALEQTCTAVAQEKGFELQKF